MRKSELIAAIAEKGGYKKKDAEAMLHIFTETVTEALVNGEKVSISGFGNFSIANRAERRVKNPTTHSETLIPARKVPVFKASKSLKEAVDK